MCETKKPTRTWGFRFFATDALVICVVGMTALVLRNYENPLWWIALVLAGHFFLFCNVFRVRRTFEMVWAGLFLVNIAVWLWFGKLGWIGVVGVQLPITAWFVFSELRSARYHGVLARRANPRLNDYLEGNVP